MLKLTSLNTYKSFNYLKKREIGCKKPYKGYRILINGVDCYTHMWNIADLLTGYNNQSIFNSVYIMRYLQKINKQDISNIDNCKILLIIDLEHVSETPNLDYLYFEDDSQLDIKHINVGFISLNCDKITSNDWVFFDDEMLK